MLYMNARAEEPICHSLCPNSLGHHALGREGSTNVHIMHRCEPGPCTDVEWLTGWLAGCHWDTQHSLEMCGECMSHTVAQPAEDSPRYKQSSNVPRLGNSAATSCSGLSDVIPPRDGISPPETQWDKSVNEGLISMDRSRELLYHLQYPVL